MCVFDLDEKFRVQIYWINALTYAACRVHCAYQIFVFFFFHFWISLQFSRIFYLFITTIYSKSHILTRNAHKISMTIASSWWIYITNSTNAHQIFAIDCTTINVNSVKNLLFWTLYSAHTISDFHFIYCICEINACIPICMAYYYSIYRRMWHCWSDNFHVFYQTVRCAKRMGIGTTHHINHFREQVHTTHALQYSYWICRIDC